MTEPVPLVADDAPVGEGDLSQLFREWREPMARLAYVLTHDAERSDEIVQDAFLKLHEHWDRVENPVGYVRTLVVNGCRSVHRRRATERRHHPGPSEPAQLVSDELADVLARLDHKYRVVLALRYYVDLSVDEIASTLHLRPSSVRTRIRRALAQLRWEIQR